MAHARAQCGDNCVLSTIVSAHVPGRAAVRARARAAARRGRAPPLMHLRAGGQAPPRRGGTLSCPAPAGPPRLARSRRQELLCCGAGPGGESRTGTAARGRRSWGGSDGDFAGMQTVRLSLTFTIFDCRSPRQRPRGALTIDRRNSWPCGSSWQARPSIAIDLL